MAVPDWLMCWREEEMVEADNLRVAAPEKLPPCQCDAAVEKLTRSPGGGTSRRHR
jgi:hypothetical protein